MSGPSAPPTARPTQGRGCSVLLVLAFFAAFGYWVVNRNASDESVSTPGEGSENAEPSAADLVREQQAKLIDEQTQAAREQTRRLYDERIELRRQKILLISERLERGDQREYDKIALENRCPHEIAVALNYLDLDDKWIVRGWWNLKPGEETTTDAMTRNAKIYFYAENLPTGWKWDGSNREGSRTLPVVDERFDYLEGETLLYEEPRYVSYYLVETGQDWQEHREVFECNPEAGETAPGG